MNKIKKKMNKTMIIKLIVYNIPILYFLLFYIISIINNDFEKTVIDNNNNLPYDKIIDYYVISIIGFFLILWVGVIPSIMIYVSICYTSDVYYFNKIPYKWERIADTNQYELYHFSQKWWSNDITKTRFAFSVLLTDKTCPSYNEYEECTIEIKQPECQPPPIDTNDDLSSLPLY